jgi:hypothetical protein
MQKKPRWTYADSVIPLPGLALDVDAKGVPEGFKFEINTKKVSSPVRGGGEESMEAVTSEGAP